MHDSKSAKKKRFDKRTCLGRKASEVDKAAKQNNSKTLFRTFKEITEAKSSFSVPIKDKQGRILIMEKNRKHAASKTSRKFLNYPKPWLLTNRPLSRRHNRRRRKSLWLSRLSQYKILRVSVGKKFGYSNFVKFIAQ